MFIVALAAEFDIPVLKLIHVSQVYGENFPRLIIFCQHEGVIDPADPGNFVQFRAQLKGLGLCNVISRGGIDHVRDSQAAIRIIDAATAVRHVFILAFPLFMFLSKFILFNL